MLHLFDQKYSKNSNIVKRYYNLKHVFYFNILWKCSFAITGINSSNIS